MFGRMRPTAKMKSSGHKIDQTTLCICPHESDAHLLADLPAVKSLHELSFNGGPGDSYPGPLARGARYQGVKQLADPGLQQQRSSRFYHLPFYFFGGVFLHRAMTRQRRKLVI